MTGIAKDEAFKAEIIRIEQHYRHRLLFPISYYFEWRIYPYNLVYDKTKLLADDIKNSVITSYIAIYH